MKFCPHCGASIADSSFQFCINCGQKLPQMDAPAAGPQQPPDPQQNLQPEADILNMISQAQEQVPAAAPETQPTMVQPETPAPTPQQAAPSVPQQAAFQPVALDVESFPNTAPEQAPVAVEPTVAEPAAPKEPAFVPTPSGAAPEETITQPGAGSLFEQETAPMTPDLFGGETPQPQPGLFGDAPGDMPDDLFAGETEAPAYPDLFSGAMPPADNDFAAAPAQPLAEAPAQAARQHQAPAQKRPAEPKVQARPQQAAEPQPAEPAPRPPKRQAPPPPAAPVEEEEEYSLAPMTEPVRVDAIQQRLMADTAPVQPARREKSQRPATPPPPPIALPEQDYDDEDDTPRRNPGRVVVTVLAVVLLFAVVTAGVALVMLYTSNRPAKLVDSFIEAIQAGVGETEDVKRLEALQQLASDGKLGLEGVSPTTVGWNAFFTEFEQTASQNELKSQLLAQVDDATSAGTYPAIVIEAEDLFLFIKRYKIVINGVSLLAPGAESGSVILLDGAEFNGTPTDSGMLYEGLMPGRYQCRLVPPGADAASMIPNEIAIFKLSEPNVLEAGQYYADITVGNCRSDDAIVYVNDNPVMETPQGGTVAIGHVALGSVVKIEIMEDGVKLQATAVFEDPNMPALNFGDYTPVGEESPPAEETPPEEAPSSSSEQQPTGTQPALSETELNNLLATFYGSYLTCINEQSMDKILLTTAAANQTLGSRITSSGNASNLFEYVGAGCSYSSATQIERSGKQYIEFNAQFKYKYKPREGEGEYTNGSNYQSVQLVYEDGKWLVNQMVMIDAAAYGAGTLGKFS